MKKLFSFLFVFVLVTNLNSQDKKPAKKDSCWTLKGFVGLNFSQTALSNWQGGGQDNIAFTGLLNYEANFKKGKQEWNNKLDAQFGVVLQGRSKFWKKNVDQLFLMSQYNIKAAKKHWYYSLMADFRSQMSPGYEYYGDTAKKTVSNWLAPAYIQLALGMDYKVEDYFSVTLSPAAGKITLVNDQNFADNGDYGVTKAVRDASGNIITPGKRSRYEFGGRLTVKFKKDLGKNVNLDTYLDLFSNYFHNPQNVDVVWNTLLTVKITKYFSTTLSVKMIYDDDIIIKYDWNQDGKYDNKNDIYGPRTQWLTNFGFGFGYKF